MATTFSLYNSFLQYAQDGTVNLQDDDIKLCLVTSSYTFAATHDCLADVLGSPSCEVEAVASPDNGYTTGGETLGSKTFTLTDSPAGSAFDAADVEWTALTATFRYGILYADVARNGVTDPLIGCILYDDSPADVDLTGVNFKTIWAATGILTVAEA